jgi:hypothetical protein
MEWPDGACWVSCCDARSRRELRPTVDAANLLGYREPLAQRFGVGYGPRELATQAGHVQPGAVREVRVQAASANARSIRANVRARSRCP